MSDDGNHCTDQFELVAALLKKQGYSTHALGKVRSACRLPRRLRLVGSGARPEDRKAGLMSWPGHPCSRRDSPGALAGVP